MKQPFFIMLAVAIMLTAACKKNNDNHNNINNNPQDTAHSPYYFRYTANGVAHNLTDTSVVMQTAYPQYNIVNAQIWNSTTASDPSVSVFFFWYNGQSPIDSSDVLALQGRTIHFGRGEGVYAVVSNNHLSQTATDTINDAYSMQVSVVTFLGILTQGTGIFDEYLIDGTCTVPPVGDNMPIVNGTFHLIFTRRHY